MKYVLLLLVTSLVFVAGCSSSQTSDNRVAVKPGTNSVSNTQPKVGAQVQPTATNGTSTTEPAAVTNGTTPTETVTGVDVAPNAENIPGAGTGRKRIVDVPQTGPTPPPARVPAGENSEMTTTMDKQGRFVETRYFKSDRVLAKVERTWLGPTESTITYTLRNGKTFSASGANIADMSRATVVDLLNNAGIAPAGPKAPASSKNDPTGAKQ